MLFNKSIFPSLTSFRINSPNNVFCHANHARVNFLESSLWNDSCMNPVPASVSISIFIQNFISSSSWLVNAFIIILIGQIMSYPICGPPIPSPAVTFKKIGIILAPYELSCILINRVIYIYVTQIRHSEQTWHICIIHQQMVAETINLECIYIAVFWMIVYGMFFQGFFHFIS